jgi:hypothetical protein
MTDKHDQATTNRYVIHYPEHEPRESDPHYKDFNEYRRRTKASAQCAIGGERQDFSECSLDQPLELHHSHIEFSLANAIDLKWLEADFPGVSNPDEVGAWIESAVNLEWLCVKHHRAAGTGKHHAAYADFEAEKYVRNLISKSKGNNDNTKRDTTNSN